MSCDKCQSERVASVGAKCSDMCSYDLGDVKMHGNYYVPDDMGIGGGDYIEFAWCLNCGKIQGKFPLPESKIENKISDEEVLNFYKNNFTEGESINIGLISGSSRYYDMLADAEDASHTLGEFVRQFIEQNNKRQPISKYPPAELFLKMFKSGDASLPWDYVKEGFGF